MGLGQNIHFDFYLKDENAEGPPVDGVVVAGMREDLGGEVVGRAAEGPRAALDALCVGRLLPATRVRAGPQRAE